VAQPWTKTAELFSTHLGSRLNQARILLQWDSLVASAVGVLTSGDDDLSPVQSRHEAQHAGSSTMYLNPSAAQSRAAHGGGGAPQMFGHDAQTSQERSVPARSDGALSSLAPGGSEFQEFPASDSGSEGKDRKDASSRSAAQAGAKSGASNGDANSSGARWGTLLRSTVGDTLRTMVGGPKQASMGVENKFYFNEKLNRWVVEGEEDAAEAEATIAPPPIGDSFSSASDTNLPSSGTSAEEPATTTAAPFPPSTAGNRYSARGRAGTRSRYVDTFGNKDSQKPPMLPGALDVLPPGLSTNNRDGASAPGTPSVMVPPLPPTLTGARTPTAPLVPMMPKPPSNQHLAASSTPTRADHAPS